MKEPLYYYTDFETFKLILQNGTLRFKESITSNDMKDTVLLFEHFKELVREKVNEPDLEPSLGFLFNILGRREYINRRLSLVACFTTKGDSRLLWDAYTMNRKNRENCKYNGVCIEIDPEELLRAAEQYSKIFDWIEMQPIKYGYDKIDSVIDRELKKFKENVSILMRDEDQSQDIIPPIYMQLITKTKEFKLKKCIVYPMLEIMNVFDKYSPFYKHQFWHEENETRMLLSINRNNDNYKIIPKDDSNDAFYWDVKITDKCIRNVILGPELNEENIMELKSINGAINYQSLEKLSSQGTGVITNR